MLIHVASLHAVYLVFFLSFNSIVRNYSTTRFIAVWRRTYSMSDISVSDEPFVVRDADHRGKGCFASRDIKAGETVLVTYTSIVWKDGTRDWDKRVDTFIDLYNNLEEHEKQEWAALDLQHSSGAVKLYNRSLRRQRPDGSYLTEKQRRGFISLFLAADTNSFETADFTEDGTADSMGDSIALFPKASRFNHSVSVSYIYDLSSRCPSFRRVKCISYSEFHLLPSIQS